MPTCRSCCCCAASVLGAWIAIFMILALSPEIRQPVLAAVHTHSQPGGLTFRFSSLILTIAPLIGCKGDYIGCFKRQQVDDLVAVYGWKDGVALTDLSLIGCVNARTHERVSSSTMAISHAEYRAVTHNPTAQRSPDFFIMSNMSKLPKGVIPEGVAPSLLNLNTGSAEHTGRRTLMADVFSALGRHPGPFSIIAPPQLFAGETGPYTASWTADPRAIQDILGLNLFRLLFDVDVAEYLAELYEYDGLLAPAVLGQFGTGKAAQQSAARLAEIRAHIEELVFNSELGRTYLSRAQEQLGSGEARLKEVVFISMFAGYGGTGILCRYTVNQIQSDPQIYIPMFKKDPAAFMLESARLFPSVGGMNPFIVSEDHTHRFRTGHTHTAKAGDCAIVHTSGANVDPAVWGDDAFEFKPGRPNAERLMTWNNELGDIRSCATAAGCAKAPRGCPGTHLALFLAQKVVEFVVAGMEQEVIGTQKGEL